MGIVILPAGTRAGELYLFFPAVVIEFMVDEFPSVVRVQIREYAKTMRERYWEADRQGKTRVLGEFTTVMGYHRKAAIRLLGRVDDLVPKATGEGAAKSMVEKWLGP